jgi:hypothetical protein
MFNKIKGKLKSIKPKEKAKDIKENLSIIKMAYDENKKQKGLVMFGQKYQDYLDMKAKSDEKRKKKNVNSTSKKVDVNGKPKQRPGK